MFLFPLPGQVMLRRAGYDLPTMGGMEMLLPGGGGTIEGPGRMPGIGAGAGAGADACACIGIE